MADGVTTTSILSLRSDIADAFCADIPARVEATRAFPGFRTIRALRSLDNPDQVLLIEEWDSRTAYEAYVQWRTESGTIAKVGDILAAPSVRGAWGPDLAAVAAD